MFMMKNMLIQLVGVARHRHHHLTQRGITSKT